MSVLVALGVFRENEAGKDQRLSISRTCEVPSELPQVLVEVIELDLCRQEDVLGFREGEHALVCAGVLVGHKHNNRLDHS